MLKSLISKSFSFLVQLPEISNREFFYIALIIGVGGIYWETLDISENISPEKFGFVFIFLNIGVALFYLILISIFFQVAFYWAGYPVRGKLRSIFLLWSWTELPKFLFFLGGFYLNYFLPGFLVNLFRSWNLIVIFGVIILIFLVWYFFLKIQALKFCYNVSGKKLVLPVGIFLLFFIGFKFLLSNTIEQGIWVRMADLRIMNPTLDLALAKKPLLWNPYLRIPAVSIRNTNYKFRRGEIIGYYIPSNLGKDNFFTRFFPSPNYIARVVGLPGEKVEIRKGFVMIGDRALLEDYIQYSQMWDQSPQKVSDNQVFVVGDNRLMSLAKYPGGLIEKRNVQGVITRTGQLMFKFFAPEGE